MRSAAPVTHKIISANLKIWCSKNATSLRKSAPWPPNISDEHVSCTAPATRNASFQILFKMSRLPSFLKPFCSLLTRCTIPCACRAKRHLNVQKCSVPLSFLHFWRVCAFSTSQLPKVVRTWRVLYMLTSKSASRHNCALFRHLNFQKCSDHEVLLAFSLANVLRATTACNCSSLIWPAGSTPAALASLLFDPPEPQIIGKTKCFATFLPFHAPGSSFFWDFPFIDLLYSSLLFSDSSHLCFSSVHIVGSLTSKLPSIISTMCNIVKYDAYVLIKCIM